jgi:hypothetical protein
VSSEGTPEEEVVTELKLVEPSGPSRKYVYVIGWVDPVAPVPWYVKIGISSNPLERLDALQTGSPVKLQFCGWIDANPYAERMEKSLHMLLDRERVAGEWFTVTDRTNAVLELLQLLDWRDGERQESPAWVLRYRERYLPRLTEAWSE